MPFLTSAPSVFFDDSELRDLIAEFSERVRRDVRVRPAMDRLIGNRWHEAEQGAEDFLLATLFLEERPLVSSEFLGKAIQVLGPGEIDTLSEIMLECALLTFPLQSAAAICEVAHMLATAIKIVAVSEGSARQLKFNEFCSRLTAGTLMGRF
jgi:hypothetical protein